MQKRKLKKISLLVSSAALVLALTVPVKAATEDVTEQAEDSGVYVFKMSEMASSLLFLSFDYAINLSY